MRWLAFGIVVWASFGFVSVGYGNASYIAIDPRCETSGKADSREDFALNVVIGLLGPIALIANYIDSGMGEDGWSLEMEHCKGPRFS